MKNLGKPLLLLAVLLGCVALGAASATAAQPAFFPSTPTAVEIARVIDLQEAAQDGVLVLGAKGGFEGDAVLMEVAGRQVRGPILVTLHVEMTVEKSHTPAEREAVRDLLPYLQEQTENLLNKPNYKTPRGEPIEFELDFRWREPGTPKTPNYDQVKIIDPQKDLKVPEKEYRSNVSETGVPNSPGTVRGTYGTNDLNPVVLAHESLHMIGLPDRYTDAYVYNGREIPIPSGLGEAALASYLKGLKPPIPPPPAGELTAKNTPGTGKCDIMGAGLNLSCRKISKRDLKWIESMAGVEVETQPGEVLLNKSTSQNLAVAYPTNVFAKPGETTVAPGVAVYCIDHSKLPPSTEHFDVGPSVSALPGYEGVAKLLTLNAQLEPGLSASVPHMQNAIWNLTDGSAVESLLEGPEGGAMTRELMSKAGVSENTSGQGLTHLEDPNANSPTTGAVDANGNVLPAEPSEEVSPPPAVSLDAATLEPNRIGAGEAARTRLLVIATGTVSEMTLKLESRAGHRWRKLKTLPDRKLAAETKTFPLNFGRLAPGRYRLEVTVAGTGGAATRSASLTVKGK